MFKKRIILPILILCSLFIVHCLLVYAAKPTEIIYPEINSIRPVTIKTALPKYAKYAFDFLIAISGLICLGVSIYGGIEFLTSAGDPGKQKSATSRIWSAFLGIALVLMSFLISSTVNPQLVIPQAGIRYTGGLVLYSEPNCEAGGGEEKRIISDAPDFGTKEDGTDFAAQSLIFVSRPGDLKAVLYNDINYQTGGRSLLAVDSTSQTCLNLGSFGIGSARSAKLFWQLPGVYFCDNVYEQDASGEWACKGEEKYLSSSTALLEEDFNDKVKAIRLRPAYTTIDFAPADASKCTDDIASGGLSGKFWEKEGMGYCTYPIQYFGAVLHEHADFAGQCELFEGTVAKNVFNLGPDSETIKENVASSVTVFAEPPLTFVSPTAGVWLCEEVNPKRPYSTNGSFENPSKCHGRSTTDPTLGFQLVRAEFSEDKGVPNDKTSSIIIDGQYLAILFDEGRGGAGPYKGTCEVFTDSDSNFRDDPIGRCGCVMGNWGCSDCLSSFIIISTAE